MNTAPNTGTAKIQLNPASTPWTSPMETPATPCNIHDEVEQQNIIGFDAGFDTDEDTDEETDPLTDSNPLNEEFHAINTFVNNLIVKPPRQPCHTQTDLPDSCLDMSAYCTQNAHGLWQLATDSNGNQLNNQLHDKTQFEHLIASMQSKCLDAYFLQDTWLEDDEFAIDVGGYHVFHHNGPKGNHLHHGVAIVLSPRYYAGWKAAGAAAPITTDTARDFVGRFIGLTIKLESCNRKGCSVKGRNKKETSLVLSLVLAYHPCCTDDDHAQFLDIVDDLLSKFPPSEIVMGANINANVGCNSHKEDDPFAPALGPHGISKRNLKGKNLLGVYMSHGL
jgi:hypothetical protein